MFLVGKRRIQIARDLADVTTIDHEAECDPIEAEMTSKGVNEIWQSMEHLYRSGVHPALTLVVRRRGKIVIKRAIGCVRGNAPQESGPQKPLHPDAPQCLFSASKAVTALLIFKLMDQGKIDLDNLVTRYVPEFGQGGKGHITVRDLMTHRAGVPFIPEEYRNPDLLRDYDHVVKILCESESQDGGRKIQGYHALTAGYIVGEIVRRVGDIELQDALSDWLAKPLGCDYLSYGIAPEHRENVPLNVATGQGLMWPFNIYMERIVAVPFEDAVRESNEDAFMSSIVPAGNMYASADDLGKVFEMLLNGGTWQGNRVLSEKSVAAAIEPASGIKLDRTMLMPMRYSPAFMLGEDPVGIYGTGCGDAFGHLGLLNMLGWADPRRDISVSFLNTGKSFAVAGVARIFRVLFAIGKACKPVAA